MKQFFSYPLIVLITLTGCTHTLNAPSPEEPIEMNDSQEKKTESVTPGATAPPMAKRHPATMEMHGVSITDPYAWLEDPTRTNTDILAHLEAENAYTESVLSPLESLKQTLYTEILQSLNRSYQIVPIQRGDYYCYSRLEKGASYQVVCRRKGSMDADEEIVLDINELAQGHRFARVYPAHYSPDMRYLAYVLDTLGTEQGTLYIKDLDTGTTLDESFERVKQFEWANDSRTLFYTVSDDQGMMRTLKRHTIGDAPDTDPVVYDEKDINRLMILEKLNSGRFIYFDSGTRDYDEYYFVDADHPLETPKLIQAAEPGLEYRIVGFRHETFYIITNADGAVDQKIVAADLDHPEKSHWVDVFPEQDAAYIEDMLVFEDYGVIISRHAGVLKPVILHWDSNTLTPIEFPEEAYGLYIGKRSNIHFDTDLLRVYYTSMITPGTLYDYNMKTGERTEVYQDPVPANYNPDDYATERVYAVSADGTQIPVSMVYKKSLFKHDGSNPMWLVTYGGYGVSVDTVFMPHNLSLLNRGFIYANAHVRGGGEYGHVWREQGECMHKKNGITDFIHCCEYLINENYTRPERLVISGGSAGGLIIGAAANTRPELFQVVIAHVPFVDLLNTVTDPETIGNQSTHAVYGNPGNPVQFEYIRSYCPYQNVRKQCYPHIYIRNGFQDSRVQYWQPAKWAAKLRYNNTGSTDILLDTMMDAGHFGPSNRFDMFDQMAKEWAFAMNRVGITE